jgi:phospholipid/cholesterol/gamma-HCH transport system ATP-binding protein
MQAREEQKIREEGLAFEKAGAVPIGGPALENFLETASAQARLAEELARKEREKALLQLPPLETQNLTVAYGNAPPLLTGINFKVSAGEIMGILGPSGCGKSSLLRHLVGLERPRDGKIMVFGENIWKDGGRHLDDLRRKFGVMYQGGALFGDLTLLENVTLPLKEFSSLSRSAMGYAARLKLALVGLAGFEHLKPAHISGGMRKRAAIARALALEPALLFLDEPSAGLDPITSSGLDDLIVTLARNLDISFVVVTHELRSIMTIVDRAILLDKKAQGIVAEGRPSYLAYESGSPEAAAFFLRGQMTIKAG